MTALPGITIIEPRRRQPPPHGGILRRRFRVGRYTVTWTFCIDGFKPGVRGQTNVQWEPSVPPQGTLSKSELKQYIVGRNAVHQEVADIIGGSIMIANV